MVGGSLGIDKLEELCITYYRIRYSVCLCTSRVFDEWRYLGNEKSYQRSAVVKTTRFSMAFQIFGQILKTISEKKNSETKFPKTNLPTKFPQKMSEEKNHKQQIPNKQFSKYLIYIVDLHIICLSLSGCFCATCKAQTVTNGKNNEIFIVITASKTG